MYTKSTMAFTKEELKQIGDVVVEVTMPMFEQIFERFGGVDARLDGIDARLDRVEGELRDFKDETRSRFTALEQKLDEQTLTIQERLDNMQEDVEYLYKLADKLENGTPVEKQIARMTIEKQVPLLFRSLEIIAKKAGVPLPKA